MATIHSLLLETLPHTSEIRATIFATDEAAHTHIRDIFHASIDSLRIALMQSWS